MLYYNAVIINHFPIALFPMRELHSQTTAAAEILKTDSSAFLPLSSYVKQKPILKEKKKHQ